MISARYQKLVPRWLYSLNYTADKVLTVYMIEEEEEEVDQFLMKEEVIEEWDV